MAYSTYKNLKIVFKVTVALGVYTFSVVIITTQVYIRSKTHNTVQTLSRCERSCILDRNIITIHFDPYVYIYFFLIDFHAIVICGIPAISIYSSVVLQTTYSFASHTMLLPPRIQINFGRQQKI